ncbi:MAG: hypothetical protein GY927_20245 [bacterium]|nr:hypothetical protein [bacterium]
MQTPVYEETHQGFDIKIHYDTDPENPRDWDNLGTIICRHPRYHLGDDHSFVEARDFLIDLINCSDETGLSTGRLMERANEVAVILPVFLYDHSGLALNTTGFHCMWDSAQVGFIYATFETIHKEYGVKRISAGLKTRVADCLRAELTAYNDYISGNVYGFVIEKDGNEVDSCWGFNGDYDDICLDEARKAVPDHT